MLKKGRIAVACLAVATTAYWSWAGTSWQLQTKVGSQGGQIQVRNSAPQTTAGSISFSNFTTSNPVSVVVTANNGYTISGITENGSALAGVSGTGTQTVSFSKAASAQTLIANFVANKFTVTNSVSDTTLGAITASTSVQSGGSAVITAKPLFQNGVVTGITVNGQPLSVAGVTFPSASPVTFTLTNITGNETVVASFAASSVNAGATQIVAANAPVTLHGTGALVPGASYLWTQVSGSPVTLAGATTLTPTFTPTVAGPCVFQLAELDVTGKTLATSSTTVTISAASVLSYEKSACNGCHNPTTGVVPSQAFGKWSSSYHKTANVTCVSCHTDSAMPTAVNTNSVAAGTFLITASSAGTVGANFCATCHSSAPAILPPIAAAVGTVHSQQAGGAANCGSCHGTPHDALNNVQQICSQCHSTIANDFFNVSPHWNNLRNNGDSAVAGDQLGTCATNKCHFNPTTNAKVACAACHSTGGANNGGDHIATSGSLHDPIINIQNGVDIMQDTCWACHEGSHHGSPTQVYQASMHFQNPYASYGDSVVACQDCHNPHSTKASFPAYSDSTVDASGNVTKAARTATVASCDSCHAGKYSVFGNSSTGNSLKTGHGASKAYVKSGSAKINVGSTTKGWYSGTRNVYLNNSSSFVTPNTACTNCHGHNNGINGEYANTMHGQTYGRWKGADYFKYRGFSSANATTITHSNSATDGCVRCHTTTGFVNFVSSGFQDLRAWGYANTSDPTSEVISCRACHTDTVGAVSGEATVALPEGQVRQIGAYPAYYNYSVANVGKFINGKKGATGSALQYRDLNNSNICVPCHSGRAGNASNGEQYGSNGLFTSLGGFAQYTTLNSQMGGVPGTPHGVYQAAILDGKIGYQFTKYTTAANGHATIGTTTPDYASSAALSGTIKNNPGPCVSCHMSEKVAGTTAVNGVIPTYRKHSFEIFSGLSGKTAAQKNPFPTVCSSCHSTSFGYNDIATAKQNFQAAVVALAEVMASSNNKYGTPIIKFTSPTAIAVADSKRLVTGVSFTGNSAGFAKLAGAYYNMNLLWNVAFAATDLGAFAHNPQYMKQLVNDTMNYVAPAGQTALTLVAGLGQIAATSTNPGFTAAQQAAATGYVNNASANHYASFNGKSSKIQYVASNTVCTTCHNPSETALQETARVAWAESTHGVTTGPWSGHDTSATTPYNGASIPSTSTDPCIRCHVADGFIQFTDNGNYSNINALTRTDAKTVYTPLNCNVCHVSPLNGNNDRRSIAMTPALGAKFNGMSGVGAVLYYNYSTHDQINTATKLRSRVSASFPDAGDSNLCIPCHAGHGSNGQNVVDATANPSFSFTKANQISGASMAPVAGMMYNKLGFINFTTNATQLKSLKSAIDGGSVTSTHRNFGTKSMYGDSHSLALFGTKAAPVTGNMDQGGPCVTCHVRGNFVGGSPRSDAGHSFQITADAFNQVCSNCHTSENGNVFANAVTGSAFGDFQSYFLEPNAEVYQDAQLLARYYLKKNFNIFMAVGSGTAYEYDAVNQNATTTKVVDWTRGGKLSNAQATKLMGAVFNLTVFNNEAAAYAHARTYTRRLVYDTLDFLDDGAVNGSVGANAVAASQAAADSDFNVSGMYVQDTSAYNSANNAITTIYGNSTEAMIYLVGWSRSTGAWSSPERP